MIDLRHLTRWWFFNHDRPIDGKRGHKEMKSRTGHVVKWWLMWDIHEPDDFLIMMHDARQEMRKWIVGQEMSIVRSWD